jgi:hypothetical protein
MAFIVACVRHKNAEYDDLLSSGVERFEACEMVRYKLREVLNRWMRKE